MKKHEAIEIVPATPALLQRFYGGPPKFTVAAVCVTQGDDILGVGGVHYYQGRLIVFSDMTDALRARKRVLVKAYRQVLEMIRDARVPVLSLCNPNIANAHVLLEHMGFERVAGEVYQCPG